MESKPGIHLVTRGKLVLQNLEFNFRGRVVGWRKRRVSVVVKARGRRKQKGRGAAQRDNAERQRSSDTVSRSLCVGKHAGVTQ